MRKVVFGGANSLDNYFARKDHSTDWLKWSGPCHGNADRVTCGFTT